MQDDSQGTSPMQDAQQGRSPMQDASHGRSPMQDAPQGSSPMQDAPQGRSPGRMPHSEGAPMQDALRVQEEGLVRILQDQSPHIPLLIFKKILNQGMGLFVLQEQNPFIFNSSREIHCFTFICKCLLWYERQPMYINFKIDIFTISQIAVEKFKFYP